MARGWNAGVIVYVLYHVGGSIESVWNDPDSALDVMCRLTPDSMNIAVRPLNSLEDSGEVKAARKRLHELMGHARVIKRKEK